MALATNINQSINHKIQIMLKKISLSTGLLTLIFTVCIAQELISGHWTGKIMNTYDIIYDFKADGNKLTGTITGGRQDGKPEPISDGVIKGDSVFFNMPSQMGSDLYVKGKVKGDTLSINFNAMGTDINTKLVRSKN